MGGPSRKTGSNRKKGGVHKRVARAKFQERHIDQVWADVRKPEEDVHQVRNKMGPMGTTDRAELDEDVPGYGRHYCVPCARYFQDAGALLEHEKEKPHKRRVKVLMTTPRPHNQRDADTAGGLGQPDNGRQLNSGLRGMEQG